jgi:hypothetical protein
MLVLGGTRAGAPGRLGLVALSARQHAPCPVLLVSRLDPVTTPICSGQTCPALTASTALWRDTTRHDTTRHPREYRHDVYRKRPPAHPASAPAVPARGTHPSGKAMIVSARPVDAGTRPSGPFGPPIEDICRCPRVRHPAEHRIPPPATAPPGSTTFPEPTDAQRTRQAHSP